MRRCMPIPLVVGEHHGERANVHVEADDIRQVLAQATGSMPVSPRQAAAVVETLAGAATVHGACAPEGHPVTRGAADYVLAAS